MQTFQELKSRGFCFQGTDESELEKLLNGAPGVRFYVGFDPTGSSLHVGHLLPVMAMRLLQRHGHVPIVLVGGATARIGDPSGKSTARPMMTVEEINANAESLKKQLSRFIQPEEGKAFFVNNADWLCKLGYIELLRDVGTIFSVNRMLAQESVKMRLETGLSFLEFNYSILQAYDFLTLHRELGCQLQLGGQDQWGNMVAGTELVRRKTGDTVQAITIPLLLNSNGQKFGKTAGGKNVWLDTARTGVFDYYQFWRNCDDNQVAKLLRYFSPLPLEEIDRLADPAGNINRAKEILACEATALAHGEAAAREAYLAAGSRFGFADPDGRIATSCAIAAAPRGGAVELPSLEIAPAEFGENGVLVARLLVLAGFAKSNGEGRRLIQGNAVAIDDVKVADVNAVLTAADFAAGAVTLRSGKKNFKRLTLGK